MSSRRSGGRRQQQRSGGGIPYLWIITAVIVVAVVGFIYLATRQDGDTTASAAEIECNRTEHLRYHVHVNLKIYVEGQEVPVPANVGIRPDCLYWLHTHDASGTVHVEAPQRQHYTLGQFFNIWGRNLSETELIGYTVDETHQIKAYVNGEEWTGNPADIPLESRAVITLMYGPPFPPPHTHQFGPNE